LSNKPGGAGYGSEWAPVNLSYDQRRMRGNERVEEIAHLLGGEIGQATIEGESFGHHPDLYLVGTIHAAGE
jgi:hypothetical protein